DVQTDRQGKLIPWNVAGPTCDSVDVCMREEMFPEDLQEGDFIYIANAGAYTTAYASSFNGFPLPEVRVVYRSASGKTRACEAGASGAHLSVYQGSRSYRAVMPGARALPARTLI